MNIMINQATNQDWVQATKDIQISAYPVYHLTQVYTSTAQVVGEELRKVSRALLQEVLAKVPSVEPEEWDRI